MTEDKPHSSGVLNDTRDFWWSSDFIDLMAKRWQLNQVKSMLDVGCGIGHWGQMLSYHLANDAEIYGIDPEAEWVKNAAERAKQKNIAKIAHYQLGTAEAIPFPDNFFDMVTCQTVLIHVNDVSISLKEMLRVLKPGGLLAVAEPNNIASQLVFNNLNFSDPVDDIIVQVRFNIICERGREALGRGNAYRGDIIPQFFHQAGLREIQVFLSDLADYFLPPYTTNREIASIKQINSASQQDWISEKNELNKFYIAGGGSQPDFEICWNALMQNTDRIVNGYKQQAICSAGGLILYLISGRK